MMGMMCVAGCVTTTVPVSNSPHFVVAVSPDGQMKIGDDDVTATQLIQRHRAEKGNNLKTILLVGEAGIQPATLFAVRDEIVKQGFPQVHVQMPRHATAMTQDDGSPSSP